MRTTIIIYALGLTYSINCFAAMTGDSVMSPGGLAASPTTQQSTGTYTPPSLSSISTNEFRYGTCPSGFKYQNGTQYPVEVRSVVTYYLGGELAGQSASAWSDLDTSCTKTEEQSISCPSGYTGNQLQRRTVATKDGNSYDYGEWNTYQINCVAAPPPPNFPSAGTIIGYQIVRMKDTCYALVASNGDGTYYAKNLIWWGSVTNPKQTFSGLRELSNYSFTRIEAKMNGC